MPRAHYDAWHNLLVLVSPEEGQPWPTIEPTDDPHEVIVRWPDGSSASLHFHTMTGEWRFSDRCTDHATQTGMYDR